MTHPLLIIPIGGLGSSQCTPDLLAALETIPGAEIWRGTSNNEFADSDGIWGFINASPISPVYLIGHSLGCDQALTTAAMLGSRCVGLALLDPVWQPKHQPACPALVFHAGNSFPFPQATVNGVEGETVEGTTHNSLCHDPMLLAKIVKDIAGIIEGETS